MQDPNEDTEWNDILRHRGILPQKENIKEITEEEVVNLLDSTVQQKMCGGKKKEDMTLEKLDELEDEEDERVFLDYRNKRLAEMKAEAAKAKFGDVRQISAEDYVQQVNQAGEGVWVVLHLYKNGIPLCTLINQYLLQLAQKFPATKFLKSISTTCIPNFPDDSLPSIFIYYEGVLKKKLTGAYTFGGLNLKIDELEWKLAEAGAVKSLLETDPHTKIQDVLFSSLKQNTFDDDDNDW